MLRASRLHKPEPKIDYEESEQKRFGITGQQIRRIVLGLSKKANVGHIGSSLSIADLVAVLYDSVLAIRHPLDPERDRFILSKGHAALALYAALFLRGFISEAELNTFCCDGSFVGVHPERGLSGVDFATGSLGQGLSMATGAALAAKMERSSRRVFCLLSDAECNEGSVWEAVMFAAHHRLANLIALIDLNGQQAFGYTKDVLNLQPMKQKWESFGWHVVEIDGHDEVALATKIQSLNSHDGPPHVILANTTFGKGVSYMEQKIEWHYLPMNDEQYELAMAELLQSEKS